jgi:hypothetical protein
LYRLDERSGNARHSVLWDFIVWEKTDDGLQALYIGPIYEWEAGRQWQFMKGLIKSTRTEGERMLKWLWRD